MKRKPDKQNKEHRKHNFSARKKKDNNFSSAYRFRSSNLKTDNKAKKPSPKKNAQDINSNNTNNTEYIAQSEKNREEEEN